MTSYLSCSNKRRPSFSIRPIRNTLIAIVVGAIYFLVNIIYAPDGSIFSSKIAYTYSHILVLCDVLITIIPFILISIGIILDLVCREMDQLSYNMSQYLKKHHKKNIFHNKKNMLRALGQRSYLIQPSIGCKKCGLYFKKYNFDFDINNNIFDIVVCAECKNK